MHFLFLVQFWAFLGLSTAAALPAADDEGKALVIRQTSTSAGATHTTPPDSQCTNGPLTRTCWSNGYSAATDYDVSWPNTGVVRSYHLTITNTTMAPDGHPREVFAINGQYPGPTIIGDWGDTLQITVTNNLQNNGTSIHWHGVRQWHSNQMDGTNGITECPLAPGQSRTYTFLCTQYGTTWYHSHYSDQYTDGVVGTIIINGPATSNYDIDLGTLAITDWYYTPAFTLAPLISSGAIRGAPPGNNVLINGTNVNSTGGGQYHANTITSGKRYRLRIVNTATADGYKVSLDGHPFTVISADFVPVKPWTTSWLFVGIGQRYDVVIWANQPISSYWFHAVYQAPCGNNLNANAVSIFTYTGANSTIPTTGRNNTPPSTDCNDPNSSLVPYWKSNVTQWTTVPSSSNLTVSLAIVANANNQTQVQWNLNFTSMVVDWEKPTLQYVIDGNTSYPKSLNLIDLPTANTWSFWVIQEISGGPAPGTPHPIHLHGHDFYVLGAGVGIFSDPTALNYINPPRRDVAMLPAQGYLVLAFLTDNPGAWLFHCHIAWHIQLGLGAQFLEQKSKILSTLDLGADWKNECSTWDAYYNRAVYKESDSGL